MVLVNLKDINDNAPEFKMKMVNATVKENAPTGKYFDFSQIRKIIYLSKSCVLTPYTSHYLH